MSDGGIRQEADKTSSDENVSRLGTKIPGHDIYWVSNGGGGAVRPPGPLKCQSERGTDTEVTAGGAARRRDDGMGKRALEGALHAFVDQRAAGT